MGDERTELETSQAAPRATEGSLRETLKTTETPVQAEALLQRRMEADVQGAGDRIEMLGKAVEGLPPEEQAAAKAATIEAQRALQGTLAEVVVDEKLTGDEALYARKEQRLKELDPDTREILTEIETWEEPTATTPPAQKELFELALRLDRDLLKKDAFEADELQRQVSELRKKVEEVLGAANKPATVEPPAVPLEVVQGNVAGGIRLSGIENQPYGAHHYRREKVSDIKREQDRKYALEAHQEQADYWKSLLAGFPKDSAQEAFCQAGMKHEEATKQLLEAEQNFGRIDREIADLKKAEATTKKELEEQASLSNKNVTAEQRMKLYNLLEQLSAEKAALKQEREEVKETAEQARLIFDKAEARLGLVVEEDEENRAKIDKEMEEDRKTIENLDPKRGSPEEQAMSLANVEYLKAKSGMYKVSQELRGLNLEEQEILLKLKWSSTHEKSQGARTPEQLKKRLQEIQDKRQELEPQLMAANKLVEEKKGLLKLAAEALQTKKMRGVAAAAGRSVGVFKPGGSSTGGTREGVAGSTQKTFAQTLKGIPGMGKIIEAFKPIISLFGGGGSA